MVLINPTTNQLTAKIVYYGAGLCGKTTNLRYIYDKISPGDRGEMLSIETEGDRTLFFDLLPIDAGEIAGMKARVQLYTVPGQVFYNRTRKLVLKGVDGIVFVADSQRVMMEANFQSFRNLDENLTELGLTLGKLPMVLQFNKRDLPDAVPADEMRSMLDPNNRYAYFESCAAAGIGVLETLTVISRQTLADIKQKMLEETQQHARRRRAEAPEPESSVKPGDAPADQPKKKKRPKSIAAELDKLLDDLKAGGK